MKLFLYLFVCCSLLFSNDLEKIKKNGELRHIGVPYANFITGSGDGLEVEVMKGFAKHLKVEYKFVTSTWTNIFGDLTGQNVTSSDNGVKLLDKMPIRGDILATGLTILDWRKKVINYSTATFPSGIWLVARSDSTLEPIKPTGSLSKDVSIVKSHLSGISVLAMEDSCLDPKLYNLGKTKADIRLQSTKVKINELVPAILNNNAETTLLEVPDALIALEKWPEKIKVIGPISGEQNMAVGFRKDSPLLLEEFNKYFKKIKADGSYSKIVKKYYPDVFYYYGDFFIK